VRILFQGTGYEIEDLNLQKGKFLPGEVHFVARKPKKNMPSWKN